MRFRDRHARRRQREETAPPERLPTPPMVFDPNTARLIAPWVTHNEMTPEREQQLRDALDQIADFGDALRVPVWIFADGRAPSPILVEAGSLRHWLQRHEAGRTVYVTRRRAA